MCQDAIYISLTTWKHFDNFFLGPGLISISPCLSSNIKTKNEQNKKIINLRVLSYKYTPTSFYGNTR